jgi:hypothetical protein
VGYIKKPFGAYLPIWVRTFNWDKWTTNGTQYNSLGIMACPDPSDTFAWCAPDPVSANANYLKDAVNGTPGISMPETSGTVNLSNGQLGSVEHAIKQQIINGVQNYPSGYTDSSGTVITNPVTGEVVKGWATYMLTGERTELDPLKMNQQASVDSYVPVIVTDVVHEKDPVTGKPQWVIKIFLLPDSVKFVVPGATPGGPASQIFATQPVIVR